MNKQEQYEMLDWIILTIFIVMAIFYKIISINTVIKIFVIRYAVMTLMFTYIIVSKKARYKFYGGINNANKNLLTNLIHFADAFLLIFTTIRLAIYLCSK